MVNEQKKQTIVFLRLTQLKLLGLATEQINDVSRVQQHIKDMQSLEETIKLIETLF